MKSAQPEIKVHAEKPSRMVSDAASKEEAAIGEDTYLEQDAAQQGHGRKQARLNAVNDAIVWFIRIGVCIVVAFIATWTWHILLPSSLHWLSTEQNQSLQSLLTGGILTTILTFAAEKIKTEAD